MKLDFWNKEKVAPLKERELDEIRGICKILFIDDKAFPVIDILKTDGWKNSKRIKDVDSLEQMEVKEAHILIVDIQGVGKKMKFKDEGLGLIIALKEKYPNKRVIVYSAEDQGKIQAFHPGIDAADKRLSKNTDPYQFQVVIEGYAKEAFSLEECIKRIQNQLLKEIGSSLEADKILMNLNKINSQKDYSTKNISKIFNIQNGASIANIIQLFLTATA
jgi:DNA-binding NarL/FixJ family response regulator